MPATLDRARLALWVLVALVAIGATGFYVYRTMNPTILVGGLGVGDYRLETTDGQPFTRASLVGHPSLLFFGFTHCPDVCPTTMAEMASWYQTLGSEADDLKAYFVTIDPERDTAEVIGDYVAWVGHVTGVTGTPDEIARAASAWSVFYEKVGSGADYTMNHTASVFLLDRNGNFQGTIAYEESADTAIGKLRRLLGK